MQSPSFSKFREIMDIWDNFCESENLKTMLDSQVLIFKKGNDVYGTNEEGRVMFAKLKNPDEDVNNAWKKEVQFTGTNLRRAMEGEKVQNMFGYKDLKDIKIIDKEKAIEILSKG